MPLDTASMHWTDWAGLALLAYGLVSGWMHGILHQSTRLGVMVIALGLASFFAMPSEWLASQFDFQPAQTPEAVPLIELAFFVVALLILAVVRNLVFLWIGSPTGTASRVGGALLGLAGSLLLYLVLLSGVSWADGPAEIQGAYGYPIGQRAVSALDKLPSPPRPGFLDAAHFSGEVEPMAPEPEAEGEKSDA